MHTYIVPNDLSIQMKIKLNGKRIVVVTFAERQSCEDAENSQSDDEYHLRTTAQCQVCCLDFLPTYAAICMRLEVFLYEGSAAWSQMPRPQAPGLQTSLVFNIFRACLDLKGYQLVAKL